MKRIASLSSRWAMVWMAGVIVHTCVARADGQAVQGQAVQGQAVQGQAVPTSRGKRLKSRSTSEIADAVESRRFDEVLNLSWRSEKSDGPQADGTTALHWATHHGAHDVVVQLLLSGDEPDVANLFGLTPLAIASQRGDADIVRQLILAGATVDLELPGKETSLLVAARSGHKDVVAALLDAKAKINATQRQGQTALMWAAAEGHADVVRLLIERGADLKTPSPSGFTPLLFAARDGRREVVTELLKAGAEVNSVIQDPRSKGGGGRAPRSGAGPLMLAVENGHFELAVDLLKAGANPNDQRSGFTPLHAITWVRKPNRGDGPDGQPPPNGSGQLDSLDFVSALVRHQADVNARLSSGSGGRGHLHRKGATGFLLAAHTADLPLLRRLLKLGADPTLTNVDGCTPLMAAAGVGCLAPTEFAGTEPEALQCVEWLLDLGADINAVDANGETAMHGAAYKSLPKVATCLDDHGADVGIWMRKNKYSWNPVMIAEGHRPGNFKPSPPTLAALHDILKRRGQPIPASTPRQRRKGY